MDQMLNQDLSIPPARTNRPIWARPLIFTIVLAVFAPIAWHQFVAWDDDYTIQSNPLIVHPSFANMLHYWRHEFMDLYVPVLYTVWSGIAALCPNDPNPHLFHAASILVHAFNALLVSGLIQKLLKNPWAAAIGALLFALHPVQVETVAWASGMKDLLCGMFSLIAVNEYVSCQTSTSSVESSSVVSSSEGTHQTHARLGNPRYYLAIVAMLLAMLSKPTGTVLPVLLVIIDRLLLNRSWRQVVRATWPFFVLAIPCLIWTKLCQPAGYLRYVPIWQRPLVAADALAFYLGKLIAPVHQAFDYGRAPWTIFEHHWAWFTWIVPAAVGAILHRYRKGATPLLAGALLFVAGLLPVLGLSTFDFEMISTVADHYIYLAMLGPALACAWVFTWWVRRSCADSPRVSREVEHLWHSRPRLCFLPQGGKRLRAALEHSRGRLCHTSCGSGPTGQRPAGAGRAPAFIASAILALLAARSVQQEQYWQDSRTFFTHALEINPQSWSSWFGLGYVNHMEGRQLAARATAEQDTPLKSVQDRAAANEFLNQAMEDYRRTIEFNLSDVAAHHGYAAMLMYFGRHREAAREFIEVVRRRDSLPPAARSQFYADTDLLGQCLLYCGHPKEAAQAFAAAMRLDPSPPLAQEHLKQALATAQSNRQTGQAMTDLADPADDGD